MKLEALKSPDVARLARDTVVVLPVASIEQHGPHLPVGTDSLIGQGIVDALDQACGSRLLVMPMLKFGCSRHHMAFQGSLTLTHHTFEAVVLESLASMYEHGFRRFLVHNSHGGNRAVGGVIAERCNDLLPEAAVILATWFQLAAGVLGPLVEGEYPSVGHACEFETSVMLALHPDLVDMSKAGDDGPVGAKPPFRADLFQGGGATWSRPFHVMTRTGVYGRPTLASAEKGRRILDLTVRELQAMLEVAFPGSTRA